MHSQPQNTNQNTATNTYSGTNEQTTTNGNGDPVTTTTRYNQDPQGNLLINGVRPQSVWDVVDNKVNGILGGIGLAKRGGRDDDDDDDWVEIAGGKKGGLGKNTNNFQTSNSNSNSFSGTGKKPFKKDHSLDVGNGGIKIDGANPFKWKRALVDDVAVGGLKNTNNFQTSNTNSFTGTGLGKKTPLNKDHSFAVNNGNIKVDGANPFKWKRDTAVDDDDQEISTAGVKSTNNFQTSNSNSLTGTGFGKKAPLNKDHTFANNNGNIKLDGKNPFVWKRGLKSTNNFKTTNSNSFTGTGKKPFAKDHSFGTDGKGGVKVDGKSPFAWKRGVVKKGKGFAAAGVTGKDRGDW
ncbi:hypothetical protein HDV00_003650 [Rhizophlyctis rosea]|nr:hypothetical protein HDV00_003650 [Rhizophlyctis rosea]